jgi:hypothetical protein
MLVALMGGKLAVQLVEQMVVRWDYLLVGLMAGKKAGRLVANLVVPMV